MGSSALLDYALFQLTPTRTRCDLVVVYGGKNEKIASGLVETFVSHLKFAKDQVLKGGYSITLRPPNPTAFWFTKPTFQRVVRFISTPEILERFVHIEREISQIENSIQSNEVSNTNIKGHAAADGVHDKPANFPKRTTGAERDDDAAAEETSKLHLQRLLNTRKALLRKEQAMAYARAVVAGFEMDILENLICFADVFGASRLREACVQFKELYKKKHTDGQWMEELAAMKALSSQELPYAGTPGIILAYENAAVNSINNDTSPDKISSPPNSDCTNENKLGGSAELPPKVQLQMPWPNQISQYMYSQSPNQQLPLYQGYPFPSFFPGHMHWPQSMENHANGNVQEFNRHRHQKSSRKKEKTSGAEGTETSEDDEQTESSDSGSDADSDTDKKQERKHSSGGTPRGKRNKKKSSKTVVIRNINYITSKKTNGIKLGMSDDSSSNEALEEGSIRKEVADATQNLAAEICEEDGKNNNWSAFQTLLRSQEESISDRAQQQHNTNFQDEHLANFPRFDDEISQDIMHSVNLGALKDKKQNLISDDSVLLTPNQIAHEGNVNSVNFANGENLCPNMKKINYEEAPIVSNGLEESGGNSLAAPSDFASEETVIRRNREEDWFIANHSENILNQESEQVIFGDNMSLSFVGGSCLIETSKNSVAIDDSFMVQTRSEVEDPCNSLWRTDIDSVVEWTDTHHQSADSNTVEPRSRNSGINEPDDLCVMLVRDTSLVSTEKSWTPEMDYAMEMCITEVDKKTDAMEIKDQTEDKLPTNGKLTNTKKNIGPTTKKPLKDAIAKSKKPQPPSRLMTQKSKLETEEEIRRRMEEQLIERQKRIAERTAASGGLTSAASKRLSGGNKPAPPKLDKHKPQSKVRQTKI